MLKPWTLMRRKLNQRLASIEFDPAWHRRTTSLTWPEGALTRQSSS
jgi:hypothetical protein